MKNTQIILSDTELSICKTIAELRYANNRKFGVRNSKIGAQSDEETDFEGICAELAFCKLYNLYPDFTVFTRNTETDAGDVIFNGRSVDVKTTKYLTGKLLAAPWKKATGDLFALMVGTSPTYTFKGFMKQSELLKDSRLGDLGHGLTFIAYQNELKDFMELY